MATNLHPFPLQDANKFPFSLQEWFRQLRDRLNSSFTSVTFTGGLITVTPASTVEALTVAGTSGGVVYFDSATSWASSGLLTANRLLLGGGAGAAPTVLGAGTTSTVLHGNASGAPSFGQVALATEVSGTLPIANGGMGLTAVGTQNQVLQTNSAATAIEYTSWPQIKQTIAVGQTMTVDSGFSATILGPINLNGDIVLNGDLMVL